MLIKNKVVKNASWIIGAQIIKSIIGFVISILTARYLGPSNYGVINYAASVVAFVVPIMQLGFSNVLVQELTLHPEEDGKIIGTATILSLISSVFCIGGVVCFSLIANADDKTTVLICGLYSILLIFQAIELVQYWFQAKLLSKYTSIASLVAYFLISLYEVFLLVSGKNVVWFAVSQSIDYFLIAVILLVCYKKLGGGKLCFSKEVASRMWGKSKHYIVSSMMVAIFANTDKVMINLMLGESETGLYSVGVTCAGLTGFVFAAIIDSMRPQIFESQKTSVALYEKNIKILYCIIIYLSLLQSLFMTIFAKFIISVLYGEQYLQAVSTLKIIVWYTTFSYMGAVRNIWILGENKQRYLWIINLLGASANVILNFVLIPIWGINGAAFASLITQIFTNVIVGWIIWPIRHNNTLIIQSLNPFIVFSKRKKEYKND